MEVQCEYSNDLGKYMCAVTAICITKPDTEIKKFNGTHLPNKSDEDVEWLFIHNKTVKFCPKNLHKKFKNLVTLHIQRCGLEKISRNDIDGLENLETVVLSCNNLKSLPDDLFANTKKLKEVHFYGNKLEFLSSKLLKSHENTLIYADFRNNVKINEYFYNNDITRFLEIIDRDCTPPQPEQPKIDVKDQKSKKPDKLLSQLESYKISGKYSDLTIKVRGKEFQVHKIILAAQSPVFDDMFTGDGVEGVKTFTDIENFSGKSFESFLNNFYTGCLDPEADVVEIFELASRFKVADLKITSTDKIIENLDEDNALKIFKLGKQHASEELTQSAFKTLKENYPDLIDDLIDDAESLKDFIEAKQKIAAILKAKSSKQ